MSTKPGFKPTSVAAIEWVAKQLREQADRPKPSDAPSPEAFNLLMSCLDDPAQSRAFWGSFFRMAESQRKETEQEVLFEDDKRKQFRLIDALYAERPDMLERKAQYDREAQVRKAKRKERTAAVRPGAIPGVIRLGAPAASTAVQHVASVSDAEPA